MTQQETAARRRITGLDIARGLFVVVAVAFGAWGLHEHGAEIGLALSRTDPARVVAACLAVLLGLLLTGRVWHRIIGAYGHVLPQREAAAVFFIGQIGKYIPGSVWSLGAQADMARAFGVPPRTTVSAGLLFIWVHLATAIPTAAVLVHPFGSASPVEPWLLIVSSLVCVASLAPPVLTWAGSALARAPEPVRLTWRDAGTFIWTMAVVWLLYGLATFLVVPPAGLADVGRPLAVTLLCIGAFALSYVVGVLVVLAPAGVGVREAALIALLAPSLGLPGAAATALLVRAVHTVCDFGIAGVAWFLARGPHGSRS